METSILIVASYSDLMITVVTMKRKREIIQGLVGTNEGKVHG